MRFQPTWLIAFSLLTASVAPSAFAQAQAPNPAAAPQERTKELAFLLGKWTSVETTKGPDGKEIAFTLEGNNTWALDGRYLQIDEQFELPGAGKLMNHILIGFDAGIGKFRAYWFSSRGRRPMTFTGVLEAKKFVLTSEDDRMKISYDLLADGHYKAIVEIKQGEAWDIQTRAEYKRKSPR